MTPPLDVALVLRRLVEPFFVEGQQTLQVSTCCGFIFVGVRPASRCKHCESIPSHFALSSLDEIDQALHFLKLSR
jgi:predicted Zn-ribbon and HTH transcriptional regulator